MAMKTTLSIPNTISMADKATNAIAYSTLFSPCPVKTYWQKGL
jgi:hypothetical protein